MALPLPANIIEYQGRNMSDNENPSVEQFKRDKEMHRLIRQKGGPEVYSIFTHLQDSANPRHDWGCWPSYESIMQDLGILNRPVIAEALQWLFDAGLMEWGMEGRKSWFIPVRNANSSDIELLRHIPSFRNRTNRDMYSSNRELSIVLIENANVYQENVNKNTELITNVINGEDSPSPLESENQTQAIEIKQPGPSNPTEPVKAKVPPLDKPGTMLHRFKTAYLAVGSDPANHNKRCGVIGDAWEEITGKPRDYKFIAKVMRDDAKGVGWKVIEALLSMANKDITEDPEGYLRRILQNGNATGTGRNERGTGLGGPGSARAATAHPAAPDPNFWGQSEDALRRVVAEYRP